MTVWRPSGNRTWWYDFRYHGRRYYGSTGQIDPEDAREVERLQMRKVRRQAAGLEPLEALPPLEAPRFSDWAAVTYAYAVNRKQLKRPEQFQITLRMVLGFWGGRPTTKAIDPPAPYHNLRLDAPITEPMWLERFEQWMDERHLSGSRKNHYRSALSQMYRVAALPQYRSRSHVTSNPFVGVPRDRVPKRITTITREQFRAIVQQAAWHIRIALAIGGLAPKLRLRNVLDLRWGTHVSADRSRIIVPDHKTDRETGLPLVVPVSSELRAVLDLAWRHRRGAHVVHYSGRPIADIKTGLKRAVTAAGLVFGRRGVTYHSLRHTMATELARMQLSDALRARVMGHADAKTTAIYTHMVAADEAAPLEALGARMPVADLIGGPAATLGDTLATRRRGSPKSRHKCRRPATRARRRSGGSVDG